MKEREDENVEFSKRKEKKEDLGISFCTSKDLLRKQKMKIP